MSAGRNFDQVLRLLDSLQLNARHRVATPVASSPGWRPGEDVIIPTAASNEEAKQKYPQGFKTLKPYLRVVAQPRSGATAQKPGHRLGGALQMLLMAKAGGLERLQIMVGRHQPVQPNGG